MNQAQRYEHLVGLTEGKKLDSDYRAAFYILSSVPELCLLYTSDAADD